MRIGETIYLDYQASTPIDPRVLTEINRAQNELFANPHAADHSLGWKAAIAIEEAANEIADLVGCDGDDLIFTSGASEANAMAARAAVSILTESDRSEIIISLGDHSSVLNEFSALGGRVKHCPLTGDGVPDIEWLRNEISESTAFVSLIGVNNENGAITDLEGVGLMCESMNVPFHADLSQSLCAKDISFRELRLSFATLSSHKIYGPKGIGVFIVEPQARAWISPLIHGGGQQGGMRGGTLPTELCLGFAKACQILKLEGEQDRIRIKSLRDQLSIKLADSVGAEVVGAPKNRHPGNLLMRFPGRDAAELLGRLQPKIAASSQSACSSGFLEPSRVVQAMGYSRQLASECIRFSLGRFSDMCQINHAVDIIHAELSEAS